MSARVTIRVVNDFDSKAIDQLRQRIKKDDREVRVGIPDAAAEEDGTSVATIAAAHEYGSPSQGIPERPFLGMTIKNNRQRYASLCRANIGKMLRGDKTLTDALDELGTIAAADVRTTIANGEFEPLKPATIKRKGSSRPLIDTGRMRQSITHVIAPKS